MDSHRQWSAACWPLCRINNDVIARYTNEIWNSEVQHGHGIVNGHLLALAPGSGAIEGILKELSRNLCRGAG